MAETFFKSKPPKANTYRFFVLGVESLFHRAFGDDARELSQVVSESPLKHPWFHFGSSVGVGNNKAWL